MSSCYDHPLYYHLSYSNGMAEEIRFIHQLLAKYLETQTAKILEPACGTGRVLLPLVAAGYRCTGFDNNPRALHYLQERLQHQGLRARVLEADMAHFRINGSGFDGAVCTVDTFRHLLSEAAALSHLQCIARHLRRHGIYLLALHLLPRHGYSGQITRWRDRQGGLQLHTTISVLDVDRRRREETLSIVFNVRTARTRRKYRYVYQLRTYTLRQLTTLLARVPALELAGAYEYYAFNAETPVRLHADSEDIVLVLRKK